MKLAALALSLALLAAFAQETYDPQKHPWMKWKPGSFVRYRMTTEMAGQKQEGEITYTLSEVTASGYALKVKAQMMGMNQEKQEQESVPVKVGTERLKVRDKEYACTIWMSKGKRGDFPSETRFWTTDGVSFPLKTALKVEGEEAFEMVAVSVSEEVTVAGKTYGAVMLSGKMKTAGGEAEVTTWMSDQVPGGALRMETRMQVQGATVPSRLEAVEIVANK